MRWLVSIFATEVSKTMWAAGDPSVALRYDDASPKRATIRAMTKQHPLAQTYESLRRILLPYAKTAIVDAGKPGHYRLSSRTLSDRAGRPLFVAAVQIGKRYVSFHLMPVYTCPDLVDGLSPTLRKRMQGQACFNFTTIGPAHVKELAALTKKGMVRFGRVKLPWS